MLISGPGGLGKIALRDRLDIFAGLKRERVRRGGRWSWGKRTAGSHCPLWVDGEVRDFEMHWLFG
jgi:hypothetical protein